MKRKILDFFKGMPIGMANVVPGFSGGTMAVILGVYERLIHALGDIFREPLKVMNDMWALSLGVIAGIIIAVKAIIFLLVAFPIPTTMFFIGLVIGSIPDVLEKANRSKIKAVDIIACFACVVGIIVFSFIKQSPSGVVHYDFKTAVLVFFLSAAAAAAMVIPGVSGSFILLAVGFYDFIWEDLVGSFISAVTVFDIHGVGLAFINMLPFVAGVLVGIVLIAKIIKMLFNKYPQTIYYAIFGLLVASPFAIIHSMYRKYRAEIMAGSGFWGWAVGILSIIISAYLVNYLSRFDTMDEKKSEPEK